ncbi:hypothetical protein H5410_031472 [Solanum commersonii]|uniref:Reverse transcriptase domain-containing protein n=1 Tax=Solanum commersonii TaxID=4109 RepID=A0A9J5YMG2_SOLCO|nr:hypothetical protein H5410_031472 [Solanum commersonii]
MNSQKASVRLKYIQTQFNIPFIAIQEPMVRAIKIQRYKLKLGTQQCYSNCNNKIWLFWTNDLDVHILDDTEQQVICRALTQSSLVPIHLIIVFSKCTLDDCRGKDVGIYENRFTRGDNRGIPKTIWMILDMMLINEKREDVMRDITAFGDIYDEPKKPEQEIIDLEDIQSRDSNLEIRAVDSVLRQKAKANWLKDGDKNTTYFHSVIKKIRRKLNIQKIQDADGVWFEMNEKIASNSGHPSSPSLFVLSAELLFIMLKNIQEMRRYKGFHTGNFGPQINHLTFTDGIMIFMSSQIKTMNLIMMALTTYEATSG